MRYQLPPASTNSSSPVKLGTPVLLCHCAQCEAFRVKKPRRILAVVRIARLALAVAVTWAIAVVLWNIGYVLLSILMDQTFAGLSAEYGYRIPRAVFAFWIAVWLAFLTWLVGLLDEALGE